MTSQQKKQESLFKYIENQHGYFTAKQAEAAGFLSTNFAYHVKTGAWLREDRGIYRLKNFPHEQVEGQYTFYSLWSRDRDDHPQGVYSHESAMGIHELSDLNPSRIHMTVPEDFRKSAKIPKILKLYYGEIDPSEIQSKIGYQVTTPMRTIIDLIQSNETSLGFVEQGFHQAIERGFILLKDLKSNRIPKEIQNQLSLWLSNRKKAV